MALTVKSRRARSSSIVPGLDVGKRRRGRVRLAAGGDHVELPAVREADDCRAEPAVRGHLAAQARRELDRVALDGEVDVEAFPAEQEVADGAADEVDALAAAAGRASAARRR